MIQIIEKQNRYKFIFFKFFSYSSFNLFLDARHNEHTNAMLEKIKCKNFTPSSTEILTKKIIRKNKRKTKLQIKHLLMLPT